MGSPSTRALRWWSAGQLAAIARALEKALRGWEHDWGLQQPQAAQDAVRCTLASESAAREAAWKAVALDGTAEPACELWWELAARGAKADPVLLLVDALFGAGGPSARTTHAAVGELAAQTAHEAWADLWRSIARALAIAAPVSVPAMQDDALATPQPHEGVFRPWSGAVVIELPWCAQEMRILLGGNEAAALLTPRSAALASAKPQPLVPVWHAAVTLEATVRAELAPVELTLGAIKSLRVGDVVELAHALDRPLLAKSAGGETLGEAFLGKVGERRAIELLAPPAGA